MKLETTLLSVLLATAASVNVYAAEPASAMDSSPAKSEQAQKPMKPHNHMQEKTGMPAPAPTEAQQQAHQKHDHKKMHDHTKEKR